MIGQNPIEPGDLCVVIDTGHIDAQYSEMIGKTVIVLREWTHCDSWCGHDVASPRPYFVVTGFPDVHISHVALKKIPPAPMQYEADPCVSVPTLMQKVARVQPVKRDYSQWGKKP